MNPELKSADSIPGSLGLPILGNLVAAFKYRELFYWQRYWQYGKVFNMPSNLVAAMYLVLGKDHDEN